MSDATRDREEEGAEAQAAPLLNAIDNAALAMEAMAAIGELMRAAKAPARGEGIIACPRCAALGRTGDLRYTWVKVAHGSRRNKFAAECASGECLKFSGH